MDKVSYTAKFADLFMDISNMVGLVYIINVQLLNIHCIRYHHPITNTTITVLEYFAAMFQQYFTLKKSLVQSPCHNLLGTIFTHSQTGNTENLHNQNLYEVSVSQYL